MDLIRRLGGGVHTIGDIYSLGERVCRPRREAKIDDET